VGQAIKRAAGAELVAVASRSKERAEAWAAAHGVPKAYGSYAELVEDPEIDALYIPLPPSLHAEWTIRAVERGKHVLCEKPLAATVADAEAMVEACRRHSVQLMDGVMWVHHERTEWMERVLASGQLGRLRRVTSSFTFNWPQWPEADFRLDRSLGGGSLLDLGYYCVRATLWAFQSLPAEVWAAARYYRDVDVNLTGVMLYPDERIASFDCGFDTQPRRTLEVAGTDGSLSCDDFTLPWQEGEATFRLRLGRNKASEYRLTGCIQEVRMIERFGQCVRSGQLNVQWPADALETMRVCDALDRAARTGERVAVTQ